MALPGLKCRCFPQLAESSRVQVPQSLQLLSWGWEHGWGFWGLFFSAEEPGLGSEVVIAGRLHHPGSLMGRGSGGVLWGPWLTWQQFLVSKALEP